MHKNTIVSLPRVHMAGSGGLDEAHLEVGAHGLALFLSRDAPFPVLDIDGTREQLRELVARLAAALRDPEASAVEQIRDAAWDCQADELVQPFNPSGPELKINAGVSGKAPAVAGEGSEEFWQ